MALYFGQDLTTAKRLTPSEATELFECQNYQNWKKNKENEAKSVNTVIGAINNVIKSIGVLSTVLSRRRR